MTKVYFVRHAQPDNSWEDDRTRPLTDKGMKDVKEVTRVLGNRGIDAIVSSPYKRSVDTVKDLADFLCLKIKTDERLRERKAGLGGKSKWQLRQRWADFSFHEEGGECLADLRQRNLSALSEILKEYKNKNIVVGTHGAALSTILNCYNSDYNYDSFVRIINYMPYIISLDFDDEQNCISMAEELIIENGIP